MSHDLCVVEGYQRIIRKKRREIDIRLAVSQSENEVRYQVMFPLSIQVNSSSSGQGVAVKGEELLLDLLHMGLELLIPLVTNLGRLNSL